MGEHNTSGERKTPKPVRFSAALVPAVGLLTVLVGCIIAWNNASATMGWFSYAPLSNELFMGNGMAFVTQGTQIGLGVALTGLLVLAFWAGFRIGRSASPKNQSAPERARSFRSLPWSPSPTEPCSPC